MTPLREIAVFLVVLAILWGLRASRSGASFWSWDAFIGDQGRDLITAFLITVAVGIVLQLG